MTHQTCVSNISYNDYLDAQIELISLYEHKRFLLDEANSYMPDFASPDFDPEDYTVEDEMYIDEIFAEILPPITEKIKQLVEISKNFKSNFRQSIYLEYIKRKMHPDNVNRFMIENNIEFYDIPFKEMLLE
jgi:hypothetical protein